MTAVPSLRAQFMVRELDATGILPVSAREFCRIAGLDLQELQDPVAMVSLQSLANVYEEGAKQSRDDAFGLHVGERSGPGMIDIFDYALISRPTLAKGFEELAPLLPAFYPEAEVKLFVRDGLAVFSYRMDPHEARAQRHRCEAMMTSILKLAERTLQQQGGLEGVMFQHAAPRDTTEHRRIFGAPVYFNCAANELLFSPTWLTVPLATADADLCAVLNRQLKDLLARVPTSRRFSAEVRHRVRHSYRSGGLSLPLLARSLGLSERTLQRRLRAEGTTLQELIEEVRHELSLIYLRDPGLSVGEVANRLGYASLAAFSRAFRRWRGMSPAAHRSAGRPLRVA